jgi:hypothetical protein
MHDIFCVIQSHGTLFLNTAILHEFVLKSKIICIQI